MLRRRALSAFTHVFNALWRAVSKHEGGSAAPSFETGAARAPQDEAAQRMPPSRLLAVSKHEGPVPILRDARTRDLICGSACARALLRMRTAELAARRRTVRRNFHLTMSNSPSRSRGAFASGSCNFASLTPNEGWAERRETFGCSAEHPWGVS